MSRVGTDRVKRLPSVAFIMRAARGFAVDGDKIVPTGPERPDPVFKTPSEQKGIDAINQCAQPTLARNAIVKRREPAKKLQMRLAPSNDIVEVVTRSYCAASQKKKD